jgi:hypothetical protein
MITGSGADGEEPLSRWKTSGSSSWSPAPPEREKPTVRTRGLFGVCDPVSGDRPSMARAKGRKLCAATATLADGVTRRSRRCDHGDIRRVTHVTAAAWARCGASGDKAEGTLDGPLWAHPRHGLQRTCLPRHLSLTAQRRVGRRDAEPSRDKQHQCSARSCTSASRSRTTTRTPTSLLS